MEIILKDYNAGLWNYNAERRVKENWKVKNVFRSHELFQTRRNNHDLKSVCTVGVCQTYLCDHCPTKANKCINNLFNK